MSELKEPEGKTLYEWPLPAMDDSERMAFDLPEVYRAVEMPHPDPHRAGIMVYGFGHNCHGQAIWYSNPPTRPLIKHLLDEIATLRERVEGLEEALTPSAETKAAFIGEFWFERETTDEDGGCYMEQITVPWTTVKEIMKAIRNYALVPAPKAEPERAAHE